MLKINKLRGMLLLSIAFLGLACASPSQAQLITDLSDITNWTGTGTNSSALVISWNDGVTPVSLAWGFHWDGVATGEDMLEAIAGATYNSVNGDMTPPTQIQTGSDISLNLYVTTFPSFGDFVAVTEITYQNGSLSHDQGIPNGFPDSETGWQYFAVGGEFDTDGGANTENGTSAYPGTGGTPGWTYSLTGFSQRILADDSWDAWAYNDSSDFSSVTTVTQPVAASVPEPSDWALVTFGVFSLVIFAHARRPRLYAA